MEIFGGYHGRGGKQPHNDYVGLQKSLQQEWDFVQSVTPDIGKAFQLVEDALPEAFLPSLLRGSTYQMTSRLVTGLPVKQAVIDLPYPTQIDGAKWTASCVIT